MNYDDAIIFKKINESISIFLKKSDFLGFFGIFWDIFRHGVKIVRNAPLLHRHRIVGASNNCFNCTCSHHLRCGVKTVEKTARFTPHFFNPLKMEIQQVKKLKSHFLRMK